MLRASPLRFSVGFLFAHQVVRVQVLVSPKYDRVNRAKDEKASPDCYMLIQSNKKGDCHVSRTKQENRYAVFRVQQSR